jgi:dienelactone hydrolase
MKPIFPLLVGLAHLWLASTSLQAQPVPHHFSGINSQPDGTILLSLQGSVSNMFNLSGAISNQFAQMFDLYPVETSTNLTDWTPRALLLRTNNNLLPLLLRDTNSVDYNRRFYRTPTNHLITLFPTPSGPFTVGTVARVMIDPARTNLYRYTPATNAFMVTFWYPADPPAAAVLPSAMRDTKLAADLNLYSYFQLDYRWSRINAAAVGHRFTGLPVVAGTAQWPVIIFSHGLPVFRQSVSHEAEELASHGYIVIAPDHSDCWATEFPDGRYLSGNLSGDVPGRLKDMEFLLGELARLNASDPLLAGRLDLHRVALYGHSYGGGVAQTTRADTRVKCIAIYDAENTQPNGPGLQQPLLAILGQTNMFYSEDRLLFSNAATNAVFLQIAAADHGSCIDYAWEAETPWARGPALAIDACLLWFFDTYLKGANPSFPTNREIYNVQKK